jgi:hypothetical protein
MAKVLGPLNKGKSGVFPINKSKEALPGLDFNVY